MKKNDYIIKECQNGYLGLLELKENIRIYKDGDIIRFPVYSLFPLDITCYSSLMNNNGQKILNDYVGYNENLTKNKF